MINTRTPRKAAPMSAEPQNSLFQSESGILITDPGGIMVYSTALETLTRLAPKPTALCAPSARNAGPVLGGRVPHAGIVVVGPITRLQVPGHMGRIHALARSSSRAAVLS